jgi:hypothetical protein
LILRIAELMRWALVVAGISVLLPTNSFAVPQLSPAADVYRSQYKDFRAKATSLLERSRAQRSNRNALQEEGFALTKLVHRLSEEADRDNVDRARRGQPADKSLLLVSQACGALDFMLNAINNYNDTGDLAFVQLARQALALMDATEQFF